MKALVLGVLTILMVPAAQADAGFSNGNNIDVTYYSGWVHVRGCEPGYNNTHHCTAADYNPGAFDRFVIDQNVDAKRVELTAFHQDGSKRTKKKSYNANKGVSKKFNLLVSTLFQRPLLEEGVNRVSYSMTNGRREVANGEFEATVEISGEKSCPDLWISGWGSTCDNVSSACNEYFNRVTGCQ